MDSEEIKVEKGVRIPRARGGRHNKSAYPWKIMEVGDSFLFPKDIKRESASAGWGNAQNPGKKFTARKTPQGIRCWRIE